MAKFAKSSRQASKARRRKVMRSGRSARRARVGRIVLSIVVMVLLVLPAVLLADPITYVPPIAAGLLVIVSWFYLRVLQRSLSMGVAQMTESCERGEITPLSITLQNKSALPFPRIQMDFYVTDLFGDYDDVRTLTCALGGKETSTIDFDVSFAHLGVYRAGVNRVVIWDLIGLFSHTIKQGVAKSVAVRPRRVRMGQADVSRAAPDESLNALRPIASDDVDYLGVREYRYGDPLKTVHWNLSARSANGQLYTRLFEAYVNPSLVIVVDPYAPELGADDLMSLFDGMIEVTATLCEQAREVGVDAEVRYLARDGEPAACHLMTPDDADGLVASMMPVTPLQSDHVDSGSIEEMLRAAGLRSHCAGNIAYVAARPDAGSLAALSDAAAARRNTMAFLAVPRELEGRERDQFVAPLRSLGDAGGAYYVVESTEIVTEVMGL